MGCSDYYDPARDREDERWRINTQTLKELRFGFRFIETGRASLGDTAIALCHTCGAMVWCGDLRRIEDLPDVSKHHQWHQQHD